MNSKPLLAAVFGTIITLLLMVLLGAHFDSDESVFYFVVNSVQANSCTSMPATNNEFVLFYLYLNLKKAFLAVDVFSWGKIFFFSSALSLLIYKSCILFKNKLPVVIVNILFVFLFLDAFLLVNHVRTSTYLAFVAVVFLFKADTRKKIFIFYLLVVFAIFNRVEISLLNFATAAVSVLLFKLDKAMLKHLVIAVFLAFLSLVSLWFYNQQHWAKANAFFRYERSLEQNKNFILSDEQIQAIFSGEHKNREDLIAYANGLLLIDKPFASIENLGAYIRYPNFKDYVFNNPDFKDIYRNKIEDLYLILKYDLWYLILAYLLLLFLFHKQQLYAFKFISIGLFLFYLCSLLLVLTVLVGLDVRTVQVLLVFPLALLLIAYLYKRQAQVKFLLGLVLVFLLISSRGLYTTFTQWTALEQYHLKALALNEYLGKDKTANSLGGYVLDFTQYGVLPSKLFSYQSYNAQFLSMGHFENLPLFEKKKQVLLGKDFDKLPAKFDFLIQHSLPIYSTLGILQFQKSYLEVVHAYTFEIVEDESFEPMEFPNLEIRKFSLISK